MGVGLGLEIGNSIIPKPMGNRGNLRAFSLKNPLVIDLTREGYIDFVHSVDNASRDEVKQIVDFLRMQDCQFSVWVNHARARTDLGSRASDLGDNPYSDYYHSD